MLVKGKKFEPHPAGQFRGVCVDVVDMGEVEREYPDGKTKVVNRLRIVFETDGELTDGKPATVALFCNATIGKNSTLAKMLKTWLGRDLTAAEIRDGFDVEAMIGEPAWLIVSQSDDGQYANIDVLAKMPKGMAPLEPTGEYVRVQDRDDAPSPSAPPTPARKPNKPKPKARPVADPLPEPDDDDLPF